MTQNSQPATDHTLRDRLIARIDGAGPMPFEQFMEACLYDPESGFFAAGPLRSTQSGDFLTSPEVSPWFGRTIAKMVAEVHRRIGEPFTVVDVGAGSGSLLRAMQTELVDAGITYWAADASPAARASLAQVVGEDRVVASIADAPGPLRGVVVANELLDNLPVALVVATEEGWEERWVGASGGALCLVAAPVRPEVAAWADAFGGTVPVGGMVEVQIAVMHWIETVASRLEDGLLLAFDYGGTTEELEPRRTRGTLRTYRGHHLGPDPLTAPGETDITVDVNFSAVAAAMGTGVEVMRQDDMLAAWGLRDAIRAMRHEELAAAKAGETMRQLALRAERTDAETLLHPRGLGDFRVAIASRGIVATKHGNFPGAPSVTST